MIREVEVRVKLRLDCGDDPFPGDSEDDVMTAIRRHLEGTTIYWKSADERYPLAGGGACAVVEAADVEDVYVEEIA